MKRKLVAISTIALIILVMAGSSMAWFMSDGSVDNIFRFGTIEVEVVEEGFTDVTGAAATTYEKNVQVRSLGSKKTYVRVRLVPEWSNSSLPVSNVELNLSNNGDWVYSEGYYYYTRYLEQGEITSLLLNSVTFTDLGPEYVGETFTLKVVAEGAQVTNGAWKDIWGISTLPF